MVPLGIGAQRSCAGMGRVSFCTLLSDLKSMHEATNLLTKLTSDFSISCIYSKYDMFIA